jgi:signal peptidase I
MFPRASRAAALVLVALLLSGCSAIPGLGHRYKVESASMSPTFQIGDTAVETELPDPVPRGQLVVQQRQDSDGRFVRRVIGLPGERIEAVDGLVRVDGKVLAEPWLASDVTTDDFGPVAIGPDQFFLMGDNRPDSLDSRVQGPAPRSALVSGVKDPAGR